MQLPQCVSRTRVFLTLTLRNEVVIEFQTPWADAFSAGVSMLQMPHACTLLLQQGTHMIHRLRYDQFEGGMYAIRGDIVDVQNEIRHFDIKCQLAMIDSRVIVGSRGAKVSGVDYSMKSTKNGMLQVLRLITDSLGGGAYLNEEPEESQEKSGSSENGDDVL